MSEFRDRLNRSGPIVITPHIRHRVSVATGASLAHEYGIAVLPPCTADPIRFVKPCGNADGAKQRRERLAATPLRNR